MYHKKAETIREEIAFVQDRLSDQFEACGDNKAVDSDGSLSDQVDRLQAELELVEKIEEIENMADYGRNSPMDRFEDFMNECFDEVNIGTLSYSPYTVLKAVDPIAFRETYWAWANMEIEAYCDMFNDLDK